MSIETFKSHQHTIDGRTIVLTRTIETLSDGKQIKKGRIDGELTDAERVELLAWISDPSTSQPAWIISV